MRNYYRLPRSRVKALPDEATFWDASGPFTVWIHGKGKKPGTLVVGSKSGDEVWDAPEAMVKRRFSKAAQDPYKDFMIKDNMVGTARVRTESLSLKHIAASLLREADEEDSKLMESGEDSLDAQVDKYLASYESEAQNVKQEGLDFRMLTRRFLLEAGEDEEGGDEGGDEPADEPADEGGDEGGEDEEAADEGGEGKDEEEAVGDEDEEGEGGGEAEKPKKMSIDEIDVESFAAAVVRLVDNYDSLLEVRNTILRRSANYLVKNYEPDVLEAFKEQLLDGFGMEIGKTKSEEEDEFQPPKAGAAGPMGGGGG